MSLEQHGNRIESLTLLRLGSAYLAMGDTTKAFECYKRAQILAQNAKDWQSEFVALMSMEIASRRLGNLRQAERLQGQMYALASKQRDYKSTALAFQMRGNALLDVGHWRKARQTYRKGLKHARLAGDQVLEIEFLYSLARIAQIEGNLSKAAELVERTLNLARLMGNRVQESDLLGGLGDIYLEAGKLERAIQCFEQNPVAARHMGNRVVEVGRLASLGQSYHRLGKLERVARYYEQALRISREIGQKQMEARLLTAMGNLVDDLGEEHRAVVYYEQALILA